MRGGRKKTKLLGPRHLTGVSERRKLLQWELCSSIRLTQSNDESLPKHMVAALFGADFE